MLKIAFWVAGLVLATLIIDRLLLWAEAGGWINYRKNGLGRPGSIYHLNELNVAFGGKPLPVIEEQVRQDEAGDPLKRDGGTSAV